MAKKAIFSKLKNYNNEVELILEKKEFSESIKNLILSMFYKIEVAYNDYITVKPYTRTKSEFIEYLMRILSKGCREIEMLSPSNNPEGVINSFVHGAEPGKLVAYPNTTSLLYSLIDINRKSFYISSSYSLVKEAFREFLNITYCIDGIEVIRDFDGWSWNIDLKDKKYIEYNLIYQNIQILAGNKLFEDWKNDFGVIVDYIYKMILEIEERYSEKEAKELYISISKALLVIYINNDEKINFIKEQIVESKSKIEFMQNKASFLQSVSNTKKEYVKQIKAIDTLINTPKQLEREFVVRNRKLDDNHKIFSISGLVEILNSERRDIVEKIQECNESIDPRIYARKIERLNENIAIAESIEKLDEKGKLDVLIKLQKEFLQVLKTRAEKLEQKKDICELIAVIRYYSMLPITQEEIVKDILSTEIFEIQNILFKKACELKIIDIINKDIHFNSEILALILDTKIVDLTEIEIKLSIIIDDELEVEIYEGEILESRKAIKIPKGKTDFTAKLNKKFRLYN